ncbi:MAG: recombination regulator RecX [Frankiales bacterium]|nr:recombination regulator RecX [Frankiales bacterium]
MLRVVREGDAPAAPPVPRRAAPPGLRGALDGDETERARQLCLNELDRAPRTRTELAGLLQRKEIAPDVAEAVLTRFVEAGLIDDAALAESWVATRHRDKGLSRGTLSQELRRRGVEEHVAAEAVAAIDPDDELAAARQLIERKRRSTAGLEPQVRVRRLVGLLARKGYPAGVAFQVVRDALAEEDAAYDELVDPEA